MPRVSICLPNLNNRPYLEERLQSIYDQTVDDWELVIVDNYSDDGAWELFQEHAVQESRIRLSQEPKAGMYANWNNTLELAQGEWIYIATSDDTMYPTCLERCLQSIEQHPETRVLMFGIDTIDAQSNLLEHWHESRKHRPRYVYGATLRQEGTIPGQHEFVAQLLASGIYQSITGVLLHRDVIETIGPFPTHVDSAGDSSWILQMCAQYDIHWIPENLATWRLHSLQGSRDQKKTIRRDVAVDHALNEIHKKGLFQDEFLDACETIRSRSKTDAPNPRAFLSSLKTTGLRHTMKSYGLAGASKQIHALMMKLLGYSEVYRFRAQLIHQVWQSEQGNSQ